MNSYNKLISNSIIFAIGNLGSKLITILLVPLYTYYLSTEQYGVADLVMTTITLLLPIVFGSIYDAVLRFVMDKEIDKKVIVSNTLFIGILGFIIALIFYPFFLYFDIFGDHLIYLYVILLLKFLESYLSQYARAIGMSKTFAINGILLSIIMGLSNIIFLIVFNLELDGYFLSHIIANIFSVFYLFCNTKIKKQFDSKLINFKSIKNLLKYSIPMIPNSIMWWLVNASSRYIIVFYLGISANGIYGISSKIPSVISLANQIFSQAWQISAIEDYGKKDTEVFYSKVFSFLSSILLIGISLLTMFVKVIFDLLFANEYFSAWESVPFLAIGAMFSSLSAFLGTNYIVSKQTTGVFKTSLYGGITSLILNIILIPNIGIQGAGISSMMSFFMIFIIRYFDTKKIVEISINWKRLSITLLFLFIQIIVLNMTLEAILELLINSILFLIILVINKNVYIPSKFILKTLISKVV